MTAGIENTLQEHSQPHQMAAVIENTLQEHSQPLTAQLLPAPAGQQLCHAFCAILQNREPC
jgi:hypothetical protein